MPVQKFSETHRPTAERTAAVQKQTASIVSAAVKVRAEKIVSIDTTVSKLTQAFRSNRKFTRAELTKVLSATVTMNKAVAEAHSASLKHFNTALRLDMPTARIVAQTEDLAALRTKVALLHTVANATLSGDDQQDDLVQIDDSGYVMDGGDDVMDQLPSAPEVDPTAMPLARKADWNMNEPTDLNDEPVGVPQEKTVETRSSEPNEPKGGAPAPSTQNDSEPTDLHDKPVGIPDPAGDASEGNSQNEYSKKDPATSAPSSNVEGGKSATKRKAQNPSAPATDITDPVPGTSVAKTQRKADENDSAGNGDNGAGYSDQEPGDVTKTVENPTASLAGEFDDLTQDPSMAPADPLDDMNFDNAQDPDMDTLSDDGLDDTLNVELPGDDSMAGFIADEMFDGDEMGGDFDAPAAPVASADLSATARAARRMTATRTTTSGSAGEADLLKASIRDEFQF